MLYGKCIKDEPRSIIVIDSPGCSWGKCKFCAVKHQIASRQDAISQIRTAFTYIPADETKLQVVTSASFSDYDNAVVVELFEQIQQTNIKILILEQRWGLRQHIEAVNFVFNQIGVSVQWIIGLEALSFDDREYLGKEPYFAEVHEISAHFQRVNLLYGYNRKSFSLLKYEVEQIYPHFNVICINVYEDVKDSIIKRDADRVEEFYNSEEFGIWLNDPKIHILDIDPRAQSDFGNIDTFEREN